MGKKNEIVTAINLLAEEGFNLVSSDTQMLQGTLIFDDSKDATVQYGIYGISGYVRKRNVTTTPSKSYYGCSDNRWWQLNKTTQTGVGTERILTPKQYVLMAKTIIRVANKCR